MEFALRIPPQEKLHGRVTKSILREALKPLLPGAIVNAPKHGFGAPLVSWLSGPVREFAQDHFAPGARIYSLLDEELVRHVIACSFRDLERDWRAPGRVWTLLMLELWARHAALSVRLG
jgi:asparagine synthase (glutamine-hydrolysing)